MKSKDKRKVGLGDYLYGIPLEDILTPEQILQMKQKPKNTSSSRKSSHKSTLHNNKFRKKTYGKQYEFSIPRFNVDRKLLTVVLAVIAVMAVFLFVKEPIVSRVAPKYYVKNATESTFRSVNEDIDKAIGEIFGFDLFDKKEVTAEMSLGVTSDTTGKVAGLSVDGRAGYSKKSNELYASWDCAHKDNKLASVGIYANDEEVGFNVPELFGEYWVAPSATFGKEWNNSGLRKVLYKKPMGDEADLSFTNLFRERKFLSKEGRKSFDKYTDELISSANAQYIGKESVTVDGKNRNGRKFTFAFGDEEFRRYLKSVIDTVVNDSETVMNLSNSGSYDEFCSQMTQISSRLENGIAVDSATANLVEYNGKIVKVEICILYTENGKQDVVTFDFASENSKNITNCMRLSLSTGENGFSVTYSTYGNHTVKGKVFEDYSTLIIADGNGTFNLNSNLKLDYKSKIASGVLYVSGTNGNYSVRYSGNCNKKGGLSVDLTNVSVSTGEGGANYTGNFHIKVTPKLKDGVKINPTNKKKILELAKPDADVYIQRLENSDNVKKFLEKWDSMFNSEN